MNIKKHFKGIKFFWKGLKAAKSDMWASLQVLVLATFLLGTILYFVEHSAQPDVYANWYDPYVWGFMSYLGNPGKFSPGEPITTVGRLIAICISIIKILIFAVPAGLVANGFREAMSNDKKNKKLCEIRKRLRKKFNRSANKALRGYLNTLPDKGGEKLKVLNFVPQRRPLSTLQMQMGISMQDLFDTAKQFPEFRIHNLASARSLEEDTTDRFVMEHFPVNTSYGCCIDRQSDITIICTSSYDENGIGWWTYYLALFGGFNYISKDLEVDMDDVDSFFNISKEPTFEKKTKDEYSKHDEGYKVIEKKEARRKDFFSDVKKLTDNHNNWVFAISESIKNSENLVDLHIAANNRKGDKSSIQDVESFKKMQEAIVELYREMDMECEANTSRYPLLQKSILYHFMADDNVNMCNGVALRPSSDIVNFDARSLIIAFRLAKVIGETLSSGNGILANDLNVLHVGYGYSNLN